MSKTLLWNITSPGHYQLLLPETWQAPSVALGSFGCLPVRRLHDVTYVHFTAAWTGQLTGQASDNTFPTTGFEHSDHLLANGTIRLEWNERGIISTLMAHRQFYNDWHGKGNLTIGTQWASCAEQIQTEQGCVQTWANDEGTVTVRWELLPDGWQITCLAASTNSHLILPRPGPLLQHQVSSQALMQAGWPQTNTATLICRDALGEHGWVLDAGPEKPLPPAWIHAADIRLPLGEQQIIRWQPWLPTGPSVLRHTAPADSTAPAPPTGHWHLPPGVRAGQWRLLNGQWQIDLHETAGRNAKAQFYPAQGPAAAVKLKPAKSATLELPT